MTSLAEMHRTDAKRNRNEYLAKLVPALLGALEQKFERTYGFYRCIRCSECGALVSEHDASKIGHNQGCIVRAVREAMKPAS